MDALHVRRTADDLSLVPAGPFEQHLETAADAGAIERVPLLFEERLQPRKPRDLDRLVDLALDFSRPAFRVSANI